jgi:hypothetical protein
VPSIEAPPRGLPELRLFPRAAGAEEIGRVIHTGEFRRAWRIERADAVLQHQDEADVGIGVSWPGG